MAERPRVPDSPCRPGCPRGAGIALVSVLWILAFLTVVATALAQQARTETQMARTLMGRAQAHAAANAGVELAVWGLMRGGAGRSGWPADGSLGELQLDRATVRVLAMPEAGKIDLNSARPEALRDLFVLAEVDEEAIPFLVDAILDWRDPDDLRGLHGAEDPDYERADRPYGAKDAPFATVDELRLVLGMTPAVYDRVRPALTVLGGGSGGVVQGDDAPPLSWEGIVAADDDATDQAEPGLADASGAVQPAIVPAANATYTILAQARMADGTTSRVAATVQVQAFGTSDPVQVLDWRADPGGLDAVFAAMVEAEAAPLWDKAL